MWSCWLRPPAPCQKRPSLLRVLRPSMNGSPVDNEASRDTGTDLDQDVRVDIEASESRCIALMPSKQRLKVPAMRPVPRTKKNKLLPFSGASEVEPQGNSTSNFSTVPTLKLNNVSSAPVHRKFSNSFQAQQVISLSPLPLKKHGCNRARIHECCEGVGNTLKRHYETYLLEYELAHDDVDGECCLLCGSSAAGDWVNCGTCGEWAHFGCDRWQGLGAFKETIYNPSFINRMTDYAKTDGLEYICPRCSLTNFRLQSGHKLQRTADAFCCITTSSSFRYVRDSGFGPVHIVS